MTAIEGLGVVGRARAPARPRPGPAFHLADAPAADAADAPAAPAPVDMPMLLAMQEASSEPVRDRDAKRHGKAMLDALAQLQRELLGGAGANALQTLMNLVRAAPEPHDPRLAAVQRAVLVRVAVEVQRAKMRDAPP